MSTPESIFWKKVLGGKLRAGACRFGATYCRTLLMNAISPQVKNYKKFHDQIDTGTGGNVDFRHDIEQTIVFVGSP